MSIVEERQNLNDHHEDNHKLTFVEQIVCGWPLLLLFVGGAIGGLCGGAAYGFNTQVFKSNRSDTAKYFKSFLIGIGACVAYVIIILLLALLFPDMFNQITMDNTEHAAATSYTLSQFVIGGQSMIYSELE